MRPARDTRIRDTRPETPPVETASTEASPLDAAIAGEHRTDAEKARDAWRHPKETLEFFGVEADDKVVELWPGGGWYTNVIAPYLASGGGTLVAAYFDPNIGDEDRRARIAERLAEFQANYDDPKFGTIEYSAFSAESGPLTEAGTADVVLTFRNLHNWMSGGYTEKFFTDAYAALKPGGVLGVVEHRLPSTATQDPTASSGYVHEDYVKSSPKRPGSSLSKPAKSMPIRPILRITRLGSGRWPRSTPRRTGKATLRTVLTLLPMPKSAKATA